MQDVEYKIVEAPAGSWWSNGGKVDFQALVNKLNEMGRKGWELITSTDLNRYHGNL